MKETKIKLLQILLAIIIVLGFICSCSSAQKKVEEPIQVQKTTEQIKKEMLWKEHNTFICDKKDDPDIYWGEGIYSIGNDLGNAKIEAKKRALKDLSQKIEVQVTSELSRTLSGTEITAGKEYSSQIEEEFVSKIRTYTDQVITDVRERDFIDYPREGDLTYFAYIDKGKYKDKVEKDLSMKRSMIKSAVQRGDNEFRDHRYLTALNGWIQAKQYLRDFFGNLPLEIDLINDGAIVEISSYLESKIKEFFLNVSISGIDDKIYYDAQGVVSGKPEVIAQYIDNPQNKYPLARFPLKVAFIKGSGEVVSDIKTENYGQADIPINYANPQNIFSTIEVSFDTDAIPGLDLFSLPNISRATINLKKTKTVALVVQFLISDEVIVPNEVFNKVQSLFIENGLNIISLSQQSTLLDPGIYQEAIDENADYLYSIIIKTASVAKVGGYDNMFKANCGGSISLNKLPQKNTVSSSNIPNADGFGVSRDGACWDALGNLKDTIFNKTTQIIESIL